MSSSASGSSGRRRSGADDLISSINWISDEQLSSNATAAIAKTVQTTKSNDNNDFSVLSWNILSQTASTSASNETFAYKGIDLPPPQPWKFRLPQLCHHINKANADICCLQEMDESSFTDMEPFMKDYGYNGILQSKEKYAPAVATFWKKARFNRIQDSFKKRSRTLSILLEDRLENLVLAIINVHLEGHPHKVTERVQQIQHALRDVSMKHTHHAVVVCGDFNSQVHSSACSTYMNLGYLSPPSHVVRNDDNDQNKIKNNDCVLEWNQPIPEAAYDVPEHPYQSLKSAYPPKLFATSPQEHFSYIRLPQWPAAGLDQIWYTGISLQCKALKKIISSEEQRLRILKEGLPSKDFPSDHLAVGVILSWNNTSFSSSTLPDLHISPEQSNPDKNKSREELLAEAQELKNNLCFDSEKQRLEFDCFLGDIAGLNLRRGQIPNEEQKTLLDDRKKRRDQLLQDASKEVYTILKRILKLHREASKRKDEDEEQS